MRKEDTPEYLSDEELEALIRETEEGPMIKAPEYLEENIEQVVKAFNYSYRISKVNFVWTKKLEEKNKNIQAQLDGVSKAINNIVTDIQKDINESK